MIRRPVSLYGVILNLFLLSTLFTSEPVLGSTLEERVKTLEEDLKEIKNMLKGLTGNTSLRSPQPARESQILPEMVVSLDDNPVRGDPEAKLVLIEFSDYQCPFCGKFFRTTFSEIEREYIHTGKLRYVLRDYPLPFHTQAAKASEAAHCAGDQGKYWEMHDKLFENQRDLSVNKLKEYANDLKLDVKPFGSCLETGKFKAEVSRNYSEGQKAGVSGTPSFFLGITRDGKTIKGSIITGALSFTFFKSRIDSMLVQSTSK